ncbi:hypothetical protein FH972_025968 [Carpinus fangiana]|uniref:Uncharacterized protein n=1 Tax=Carpinus fangiana TaxID=176857 RepID=A0A5N6L342_9ROSI|nr:hypothetical protein FH972_025968 [Carpinus fangiana]
MSKPAESLARTIAAQSIGPPDSAVQISQTEHRLNLLAAWSRTGCDYNGKVIVELGCGQGDMTAVLANAVASRDTGRVVAIDPAPLDYGAPWTLAQAQDHLSASTLGRAIQWVQQDPLDYLSQSGSLDNVDYVVLAHSIFYLPSEDYLLQLLQSIASSAGKVKTRPKLLLAEWGQESSTDAAQAHLQAVKMQAAFPDPTGNVRIAPTPANIVQLAVQAGWSVEGESWVREPKLDDGSWEAHAAGIAGPARDFSENVIKTLESLGETARDAPAHIASMDNATHAALNSARYKIQMLQHDTYRGLGPRKTLALPKALLPLRVLLDDNAAIDLLAQPLPPRRRQLRRKLQPTRALDNFQRHLELAQRPLVGDGRVGQHKSAQRDGATGARALAEDDLVEVSGHGDIGRVADDLVVDAILAVLVLAREVQRAGDDAHTGVALGEAAAEVLKVGPVVAVEAVADLRAHVAERKGRVHGRLAPLGVGGGHLVAAVVAGAEVVVQLCAELLGQRGVLEEDGVLAVCVGVGEGGGCDVFGDPMRVPRTAVIRGDYLDGVGIGRRRRGGSGAGCLRQSGRRRGALHSSSQTKKNTAVRQKKESRSWAEPATSTRRARTADLTSRTRSSSSSSSDQAKFSASGYFHVRRADASEASFLDIDDTREWLPCNKSQRQSVRYPDCTPTESWNLDLHKRGGMLAMPAAEKQAVVCYRKASEPRSARSTERRSRDRWIFETRAAVGGCLFAMPAREWLSGAPDGLSFAAAPILQLHRRDKDQQLADYTAKRRSPRDVALVQNG